MKGVEDLTFLECLEIASIADLEGIEVPFLHINQLIENKKAVNRPKDQIDIIALEQIRKLREDGENGVKNQTSTPLPACHLLSRLNTCHPHSRSVY